MHRIFLPIYHFFRRQKALMYILLAATTLLFGFFAAKLRFEEDIIKLLPRSATSNELAFSDIGLVDKIFVQVTSADTLQPLSPKELAAVVDAYCCRLERQDSVTHYFSGIFSALEIETGLTAIDFALTHLPTFIDPAWYPAIEEAMTPEAISAQMERNIEIIENDETGSDSQLVAMDPLNIRERLLEQIIGDNSSIGGITISEGHLFCPDKTVALALISPTFSSTDSGHSTKMVRMMEKEARLIQQEFPGSRILIHGSPLNGVSNASTIKRDLFWSIGLSLILILVIMLLSFHKLAFVWQQVVPVGYGTLFAMACMYWIKGSMSLMAMGICAIVLGVAISYCLHVLIHFYYVKDVETTLREESTPVFLGMLTTIGAFIGLLFTESDLLRDFGIFAVFALIGNTLFALIFLPHFLRQEQIKFKRIHGFPLVEKINNFPWDRNRWILITLTVLIVIGVVFSPKVKFDSDLRNLNYVNRTVQESIDLYEAKTADGYTHQYFAAWADNLDEALDYNKLLAERLDSLKADGLVHDYVPITKLLLHSETDQKQRIAAWENFFNRERVGKLRRTLQAAAREYALPADFCQPFINLLMARYEPGNLVEAGIVPPGMLANYVERQESGRYMVFTEVSYELQEQDHVWKEITAGENVLVLEPFFYCRDMVEIVHDDFSTTLWISSIFVLIVLLISFRNIWIALLAFFPMFISWYVMQGYMAIFGLEFNLINIVISTFIYGIGVDYSIFVMEGLLAEARRGEKGMLEYHKVAIFYSAMVLVIVTFSLIFARHPAIHSIGMITLIGMASTILITYSLQPWVFRQLARIPFFRKGFGIPDK